MRVRLLAQKPLPTPLKCWYAIPTEPHPESPKTIFDLKAKLLEDLRELGDCDPEVLVLEVDGFELLNESGCEVINDGDLITCVPAAWCVNIMLIFRVAESKLTKAVSKNHYQRR